MTQEELATKTIVTVQVEVTTELLKNTFGAGLEGGVGYWSQVVSHNQKEYVGTAQEVEYLMDLPFVQGGCIVLKDLVGSGDSPNHEYKITISQLRNAVRAMAKDHERHFWDMMKNNSDAVTGDVLIQCACFGDVIYG